MRLIGVASIALVLALTFTSASAREDSHRRLDGREIFRFDTFGDEQLWTNVLRLHEAVQTISPATALSVGLKVDAEALPQTIVDALQAGQVNLNDPAVTIALLKLNAIVGVMGKVDASGQLTSIGITCALCHSNVDDSLTKGIGKRVDGWANHDLNVGVIAELAPGLPAEFKTEFDKWGPGMYDPRHHAFDGVNAFELHTESMSVPVVTPAIYGLRGVGFETYTGDGPISYWNSYVGVGQMGGHGSFTDPRIGLFINQTPDLVTPKLKALLQYQLSLRAPDPPVGSFDRRAALRGKRVFFNEAGCGTCHSRPRYTDVLSGPHNDVPLLHAPEETGMDSAYARRSATGQYRATPLRALWQHAPYFHDGSAPDLPAVVEHYDQHFDLNLTDDQKADLVEFLKSL
jgi:hypothetical protein